MIKLFCVIVGVKGSAFPVDIDTTESVGDLKDAIKAKKANALKNVGARNLQLFLSKAADGEWLSSGLKIVKKLKKGEKKRLIMKLSRRKKMSCRQRTSLWTFLMKIPITCLVSIFLMSS
ncbi:unnamed protein product [Peronospora effusa]|nr:unnamed protein product [Peronospora effusa]